MLLNSAFISLFLSTPSARRRPINQLRQAFQVQFLSTPSARRATITHLFIHASSVISIHALREEGDSSNFASFTSR